MHSGGNQDDRLPAEEDLPDGGSSDDDSIAPAPAHRKKNRNRLPCTVEDCKMTFDRPSALKQHMLSHTGEKPHHCEVCRRGFSTASNMRRHLPNCPVRRRLAASRSSSIASSSGLPPFSGTSPGLPPGFGPGPPPSRAWQSPSPSYPPQISDSSWPPSMPMSSSSNRDSSLPSASSSRRTYSPSPAVQPLPYQHSEGPAWPPPRSSEPTPYQPSFLEPSYAPRPPNPWPSSSRAPTEFSPLVRPSPSDTIIPPDNSAMRWSPGSTVRGPRDSESRFGSSDDFRYSTTPTSLQRYPSDFPDRPYTSSLQVSATQEWSSATSVPPQASSVTSTSESSTAQQGPSHPEAAMVPRFEPTEYPTRPANWTRRGHWGRALPNAPGPGYYASLSQLSGASAAQAKTPHEEGDREGSEGGGT